MKTVLRSVMFLFITAISLQQVHAQCTVSNIIIQNTRNVIPGANSCTVTFDVSFDIENNNGNKYIFVHAWIQQEYPNYFECENGQTTRNGSIPAPEGSDLTDAFLNIGIDNDVNPPTIITTYPPDNGVSMTTVGSIDRIVHADGSATFVLRGVTTTVPVSCGTPVVIVADLWSSQSAAAQRAHCVNCGILYSAGFLSVTGLVNCFNLNYNATVTNNTPNPISGVYNVYADINNDGIFSPAIDTLLEGPLNFAVGGGIGTTLNINGTVPGANLNQNVILVFTQTTGSASGASRVVILPSTQCSPLPVTFNLFTARRVNSSSVMLKWETLTEINNRGFAVQRNLGGNNWETIGFVNTQATDGNSNSLLTYGFNDINTTKGVTQYRIQQVDIDGQAKNSEIRAVRGDGQAAKTLIYPNPAVDGRVNVVFEDKSGTRDVTLYDLNGRLIKQWKITEGNTLQIENLRSGVYTLRILVLETRQQSVEKIMVTR